IQLLALGALVATSLLATAPTRSTAANPVVTVNLGSSTGALLYGATGFLYGLSNDGVPADSTLTGLKPQIDGQMAPGGLQHADGDAFKTAPEFFRTGGKYVMIYMQDIYAQWPYPTNVFTDYLTKVATMANQ